VKVSRELVTPTLPVRELPATVRDFLEQEQLATTVGWERALAVQTFVQRHYRYDEHFRDGLEVQRAVQTLVPGRGNHHLRLLHAGAAEGVLGRGICYELNLLVVELLRHLGVPALVCTGWVLLDGRLERPDHLFGVALLPSSHGPCVLPLEAAVRGEGVPIRPLARTPDRAPLAGLPVAAVPGPWSTSPAVPLEADSVRRAEEERLAQDAQVLERALRLIARARGAAVPRVPGSGVSPERLTRLRDRCLELLEHEELLGPLLDELRYPGRLHPELSASQQELVTLGLLRPHPQSSFELVPTDAGGPDGSAGSPYR
jgi:hypothetical protein